jgi:hypothetical protein
VPDVPEFSDPEWLPYAIREADAATLSEMAENNVDFAHFVCARLRVILTTASSSTVVQAHGEPGRPFVREGPGLPRVLQWVRWVFPVIDSPITTRT